MTASDCPYINDTAQNKKYSLDSLSIVFRLGWLYSNYVSIPGGKKKIKLHKKKAGTGTTSKLVSSNFCSFAIISSLMIWQSANSGSIRSMLGPYRFTPCARLLFIHNNFPISISHG